MPCANELLPDHVTDDILERHQCLENVDRVPRDPETTKFKQTARLLQSLWRESKDLPIGTQPMKPTKDRPGRPIGSRIDLPVARTSGANFLTDNARYAAEHRLAHPQPHQTLDADRLYCDLLSSMPMCFNLFGELWADLALADIAVHTWWPDTPGTVSAVEFEWSPGRSRNGEYLQNRSAFDVAFILDPGNGKKGVIGVETKYHEHAVPMKQTSDKRMERYRNVARESGVFAPGATEKIIGTELQQIWLDHLLALSMPLHPSEEWTWVRFVLVHPNGNPSFRRAGEEYRTLLRRSESFAINTIESLLDANVLPSEMVGRFRERYVWG